MDYWFEEDGTIVAMSKEDNEDLNNKYEHATFTNEQALLYLRIKTGTCTLF